MKAMQDKIIAIITNLVLSMAIIVVAGTISSDVTGKNEGEQNKLGTEKKVLADVNASLLEMDDLFVGVAVEGAENENLQFNVEGVTTVDVNAEATETGGLVMDVCDIDDI